MNSFGCTRSERIRCKKSKPNAQRPAGAKTLPWLTAAICGLSPASVRACAACYGQSDSAMAAGMNWGILSLLGMIIFVLGGVAGFFVFLARRSAKLSLHADLAESLVSEQAKISQTTAATADVAAPEVVFARGNLRNSGLPHRRSCGRTPGSCGTIRSPRGRG